MQLPNSPNLRSPSTPTEAEITESKLKYREEVERYLIRGEISPAGRTLLDTVRSQLGLSLKETAEVENQVLQLFQKRLENLQYYQAAFIAEIKREYPLSSESLITLEDLQKTLGLRKEDVISTENEAILKHLEQLHVQATEKGLAIQSIRQKLAPIENQLIDEIDSDLRPAITWLSSQKDSLVKRAYREVQKEDIQLSEKEINDFSFQLGQYLNLVRRAIVAQSNKLLQEPRPPLLADVSLYIKALEFVKTRIPEEMSNVAKTELKARLDYLKNRL